MFLLSSARFGAFYYESCLGVQGYFQTLKFNKLLNLINLKSPLFVFLS